MFSYERGAPVAQDVDRMSQFAIRRSAIAGVTRPAAWAGISLEPLMILLVDVTMQGHSGYEYSGLDPRLGTGEKTMSYKLTKIEMGIFLYRGPSLT